MNEKRPSAMDGAATVDILTFHSISSAAGPTCIPPATFREQMRLLADSGLPVVALQDVGRWRRGETTLPARAVVLTFDDAFTDFAESAQPELAARGWPATLFVPTGHVGGRSDWSGLRGTGACLPLLGWADIAALARAGIAIGAHGVTHRDLTALSAAALRSEIVDSAAAIAAQTGHRPAAFAFPYGRSSAAARRCAREVFDVAVGTRLAHVDGAADPYDLPRIEMAYFRSPERWRAFLRRRNTSFFLLRRALRAVREGIGA